MRIVIITPEVFLPCEARAIGLLENEEQMMVHLRKPAASEEQMRRLIESIPSGMYGRIALHDMHHLAVEYGLGGVHLNRRCPQPPQGWNGRLSRSCHSIEEAERYGDKADYLFLSPVFDSISKAGYGAAFSREQIERAASAGIIGPRTVALGGVTPQRFESLAELGFGGAALSGYVWNNPTIEAIEQRIKDILCYNS